MKEKIVAKPMDESRRRELIEEGWLSDKSEEEISKKYARPGKSESSRVTSVLRDGRGCQVIFTRPKSKKKQEVDVDWGKKWIPSEKKREDEYDIYLREFN